MIELLIISDDLTGALDTGIQFAQFGIKTKIVMEFKNSLFLTKSNDAEVLVVNAETRHISADMAYKKIFDLVTMARESGVTYIYKKTDSGLRGNIGTELKALLDASRMKFLPFIPAYPQINRVTIKGVHYMNGVPINESVFGKDPFEPVLSADVKDLFDKRTTDVKSFEVSSQYMTEYEQPVIGIFDAESENDLERIACHLEKNKQLSIMAGCAGFASILPKILSFKKSDVVIPDLAKTMLIMCGSVNPISAAQIDYAERRGYKRITLNKEQKLNDAFWLSEEGRQWIRNLEDDLLERKVIMLEAGISENGHDTINQSKSINDKSSTAGKIHCIRDDREHIAQILGKIVHELVEIDQSHMLMIIGGDTLLGFISQIKCAEIFPVTEIGIGSVLSYIKYKEDNIWLVSKSGGFGHEDELYQIIEKLQSGLKKTDL